jgi:hypothetical protein
MVRERAMDSDRLHPNHRGWTLATQIIAVVTIAVIAAHVQLPQGFTVGGLLGLALFPLWIPSILHYRFARTLVVTGLLCIVAEIWLTQFSKGNHGTTSTLLITGCAVMIEIMVGVGVILWARRVLRPWQISAVFGIGLLAGIDPAVGLSADNPWRFAYSIPITVIALSLAEIFKNRWVQLIAVVTLTAVATVANGRSQFAILLITAVLVIWQLPRKKRTGSGSALRVLLALVVSAIVIFNLGQSLILSGYLGADAQQRTVAQIDSSGSVILGGRPEIAATVALMKFHPFGYGSGVLPSLTDILVAKSGMAAINYQPNNGYVENFMFGHGIELHSMFGDLWAGAGIIGLFFAALIAFVTIDSISRRVAAGTASAVLIFAGIKTSWNLLFSPLGTSVPLLILFLGLALLRNSREPKLLVDQHE